MPLNKFDQSLGAVISFFAILLLMSYLIFSSVGLNDEVLLLAVFGIVFIGIAGLCFFVFRKFRKENKPLVIDYLNVGTMRYILGIFMVFYGVPKLFGNFFDYQLFALDSKLSDLSEFELAWYFFGKNRWQELFTGIMEFVPGILLFNRRTYYIASIILLPVTGQVFLLNLFFKIGGITFPAACILLACDIYIIYSQKENIIRFLKSVEFPKYEGLGTRARYFVRILKRGGIVLAVLVVLLQFRQLFGKSGQQMKYQKLVGVYTLEDMTKNGRNYNPESDSLYYKNLYIEKQARWNILRRFNNKTDAFILDLNPKNDSLALYINKGGIGDAPDIIDSQSVLKGIYKLDNNLLTIAGTYMRDTVQLRYKRQDLKPKEWFW